MKSICPVCRDDHRGGDFDVRLLRSGVCGHLICSRCLGGRCEIRVTPAGKIDWGSTSQVFCPICGSVCAVDLWGDYTAEEITFETETQIRTRVLSILNQDRANFPNTPLYNDFLEEREQIIYDLAYATDDELKRQREIHLSQHENDQQLATLEASERRKRRNADLVQEIVANEGNFYERVKLAYKQGFVKMNSDKIFHPLRKEHPDLFADTERGVNTSPKVSAASHAAGLAGKGMELLQQLMTNLPTKITTNIEHKGGDLKAQMIAGGCLKSRNSKRTEQETFVPFRLTEVDFDKMWNS